MAASRILVLMVKIIVHHSPGLILIWWTFIPRLSLECQVLAVVSFYWRVIARNNMIMLLVHMRIGCGQGGYVVTMQILLLRIGLIFFGLIVGLS